MGDVDIQTKRGSGAGGQHRNMTDSCVVVVHKPTKTSVKIDGRDQHQNKSLALKILAQKLEENQGEKQRVEREKTRKSQVGRGMRGDKRRTYRTQDDSVYDHIINKSWKYSKWIKGKW